jgi:arginase family enzyme
MKTRAVFFPFDLFGSGGAGAGARLLADAVREMLDDNSRERKPTRARAYQRHIQVSELAFDTLADYRAWRARGRRAVHQALSRGDLLLWVTGNHLGALPVYDELAGTKSGNILIVQLDAHLDIYNLSDCTAELSHGNFLLHCAGPLPPIVNLGHRELLLRPEYIQQYYTRTFSAAELAIAPEPALAELRQMTQAAERIFIDLDCDVLDPAFFPGVSHPLPFGLSSQGLLRCLDAVWSEKVIGVSIAEFDPGHDREDTSLAMLVWLVEYLLLRRYEG